MYGLCKSNVGFSRNNLWAMDIISADLDNKVVSHVTRLTDNNFLFLLKVGIS